MVRFELKKVFGSWGSKIALLILAAAIAISCWSAANGYGTSWINEQGDEETGSAAVEKLKTARKAWAGPVDLEKLTAVLRENQRINATPEAQSKDYEQNDIAYGWKQGFSDIRDIICNFLSVNFNDYSYYRADSVTFGELPGLYDNRVKLLKDWLYDTDSNAYNHYSDAEKQWLIQQYEAMEVPMYYNYFEGWEQASEGSMTLIMLCAMILGYLVAGIFANEFKWKSDAVYYASFRGRNMGTRSKIQAGFVLVSVAYWASLLIYTLYTLIYLGFEGWNCPVQIERWKCFYNITFLEKYLLILLGGYLGNLFSAFLVMWISARSRSAVVAVTVPFLLIFLPNFLQNYEGTLIGKILGLLPDRLLQINYAMNYFDVYSFGTKVMGAIPILFSLYILLTTALMPMMYHSFARKEVI